MSLQRRFYLIARNLDNVDDDIRHRLLDVSGRLFDLDAELEQFPIALQPEFCDIITQLKEVQPIFANQRKTSVLFDREGLGSVGRKRAVDLAQRILSFSNELEKAASHPDSYTNEERES